MKFIFKKAVAAVVAFCLVFALAVPASEAKAATKKVYIDVAGNVNEEALMYAIDNGLMSNSGNKIFPDQRLTKGAACLSLNALLGATTPYVDMDEVGNLKKGDRYYATVSIGLNAGYLKQKANGDIYKPTVVATYGYVANIFSSVLGLDMTEEIVGNNNASDTLTRGEFAAILMKLAPNIVTRNTSTVVDGDVYITKPNVVLSNTTVNGNLIITDAVGDQNVTLRSVEITGNLIVRGGGENSIYAIGNTIIKDVVVQQFNNPVSLKVVGKAMIDRVEVKGGTGFAIQGKVAELNVTARAVSVALNNATIEKFEVTGADTVIDFKENTKITDVVVTGANTVVDVAEKATIANVVVNENASGTKLEVAGKVESMAVSGTGAVIGISAKAVIANVVVNENAVGAKLEVAGKVENVAVAAKDSAVSVKESGTIVEVKAEKSAGNFALEVSKEAVVSTVVSDAPNTVVQGEGKVENEAVTGEGSEVKTEGTNKVETTPAPTSGPSTGGSGGGGGGGGGGTESTATTYRRTLDSHVLGGIDKMKNYYNSVTHTGMNNGSETATINIELKKDITSDAVAAAASAIESIFNANYGDTIKINTTLFNTVFNVEKGTLQDNQKRFVGLLVGKKLSDIPNTIVVKVEYRNVAKTYTINVTVAK